MVINNSTYPLKLILCLTMYYEDAMALDPDFSPGIGFNNYKIKSSVLKFLSTSNSFNAAYKNSNLFDLDYNEFFSQELQKKADSMVDYYRKLVLQKISGKINGWEERVLVMIQTLICTYKDIGIAVSIPSSYERAIQSDKTNKILEDVSKISEYVGQVKNNIKLNVNIVKCVYISKLDCNLVTCITEENNICIFFTDRQADWKGFKGHISARVKRHQVNKYHNGKETVLNYVKKYNILTDEVFFAQ